MNAAAFLAELRRRNVLRAAAFYAASAWLLVQVATQVLPFFHIAEWVVRWIVTAAVIGFPFAMLFSWFYEWTPQGIQRESEIAQDQSITRQTGKKLDKAIIAVLALAVLVLLLNQFVLHRFMPDVATSSIAANEKSIAVLPFTDLSPEHDQEYFSDGMAEELLNALAKVPELKVAGRTSSFSFKGKNEDLRSIGQALSVANLLEGSVRKQGNRVRITAQLIQVKDGYHLWSETYDGELTDIFDLQERIARAITAALKVVLEGEPRARLVPVATANPEAYSLYLLATTIFNHRDGPRFAQAIAALEQALQLDPKFARAHSRLAALYAVSSNYAATDFAEANAMAEREARAAIELDPQLAEPLAVLGLVKSNQRRFAESRGLLERAVALDARDTSANFWLGLDYITTGYRSLGIAQLDRTLEIDPLLPNALYWRGNAAQFAGDNANARRLLQAAVSGGLVPANRALAILAHREGRDDDATGLFARSSKVFFIGLPAGAENVIARGLFGTATDRVTANAMLKGYLATKPKTVSGGASWALLMLDEPALALDSARDAPTDNDPLVLHWLWSPYGASARALPQFPEFVRKLGLAEFWDQYGPPDLCRRRAPHDYVCE
ncbi:MAG: hypothetical protein JWQ90_1973 [Hydrocarboniphaga sp.]|uniref:tetratricopeptide repeat protein n=1 Tax=Hydrocarboniphaga sp. TaxID=2033016 RepID=UPI002629C672|nr:tetratricopeptide repeat protein [Hydrocarboniphaga sp.]MDB5969523.1 hypothetical protein [Hydrocarboniphaga sp.]